MNCRHCAEPLSFVMADLGECPLANAYLDPGPLPAQEKCYPLKVLVCGKCWLVQTADFVDRGECFSDDYAYFSSCSSSWVAHAGRYAEEMVARRKLGPGSLVAEIAANDGYLLQHFVQANIPCYGIEPTASTAAVAKCRGIEIVPEFFGRDLAVRLRAERGPVDLVVANNVLAHVPDINGFTAGVERLLAPGGIATFEFPHLLRLIEENYFDTIYHEHYSYLSLHAVQGIFSRAGLQVFDLEEQPTHGGSLRVFAGRKAETPPPSSAVRDFAAREREAGLQEWRGYRQFQKNMESVRDGFWGFLNSAKETGHSVAAYGAAAKGNTLLNFSGVDTSSLPFVVDRSPAKVGRVLPGSRIPICGEEKLRAEKPDYILILPWNLEPEIASQLSYASAWGAQFVVASPKIRIWAA